MAAQSTYLSSLKSTISKFPKPKVISFDAFGTLYTPKNPISVQYSKIASKFGMNKTAQEIDSDFAKTFKKLWKKYPNYGKYQGWSEDKWWSELIIKLFRLDPSSVETRDLCTELMDHFTSSEAYMLYDDVIPLLSKLRDSNVMLIISSNSDSRLRQILESLGLAQYFPLSHIFLSYDLNCHKPDRLFFEAIADMVQAKFPQSTRASLLHSIWHIGDEDDKDRQGALSAGWNAILVDRKVPGSGQRCDGKSHRSNQLAQATTSQASPSRPYDLVVPDLLSVLDSFKLDE